MRFTAFTDSPRLFSRNKANTFIFQTVIYSWHFSPSVLLYLSQRPQNGGATGKTRVDREDNRLLVETSHLTVLYRAVIYIFITVWVGTTSCISKGESLHIFSNIELKSVFFFGLLLLKRLELINLKRLRELPRLCR